MRGREGPAEHCLCEGDSGQAKGLRSWSTSVPLCPTEQATLKRRGSSLDERLDTYQSLLLSFREHKVPQCSRDPEEPAVMLAPSSSSFGGTGNSTPQSRGSWCSRRDFHRHWGCGKVPISVANTTCEGARMDYH